MIAAGAKTVMAEEDAAAALPAPPSANTKVVMTTPSPRRIDVVAPGWKVHKAASADIALLEPRNLGSFDDDRMRSESHDSASTSASSENPTPCGIEHHRGASDGSSVGDRSGRKDGARTGLHRKTPSALFPVRARLGSEASMDSCSPMSLGWMRRCSMRRRFFSEEQQQQQQQQQLAGPAAGPTTRSERVIISQFTLRQRNTVAKETIESIGAPFFKQIVHDCRKMYAQKRLPPALRPPSKTRRRVENQIVPFIEETNRVLIQRHAGVIFTVESEYESVASNHPTYFLQVHHVEPRVAASLSDVQDFEDPSCISGDCDAYASTSTEQPSACELVFEDESKFKHRRFSI